MKTMGNYELLEEVDNAAPGALYQAYDRCGNRRVAIRVLGDDLNRDPALKERFSAECRVIFGLRHPNIAAIYEMAEEEQVTFLVAELLSGKSLRALIAENTCMKLEQRLAVMIRASAGLDHAHAHGILHRHLQPGNIHLLPDGSVKVAGFCIALASPHGPLRGRQTSNIYLAPEQLQGGVETRQSDIFSLGLICYEFLTGIHPFHSNDTGKTLDNILHKSLFPTVEQFPELPFSLWPILERCLAKDAGERYAAMPEFGMACQSVLDELAEDSQWMRIELQTGLLRLRKAVRRPAAPPALAELLGEVETALLGEEKSDYQLLNRLIRALAEQHHLLEPISEAPLTSRWEPAEIRPENQRLAAGAGFASAESSPDMPESRESNPAVPAVTGLTSNNDTADPPVKAASEIERQEVVGEHHNRPASGALQMPATTLQQIRSSSAAPKVVGTPAPTDPTAAVSPNGEQLPLGSSRNDHISELLRRIDQDQDSVWKTVDSFMASRQGGARGGKRSSAENSRTGPASIDAKPENLPSKEGITRAAVHARMNPDQLQQVKEIRPFRDLEPPVAGAVERTLEVPSALPGSHPGRITLWVAASALVLMLAVAVPTWVRVRFNTNEGQVVPTPRPPAAATAPSPNSAGSGDPVANAIRDRLNSARRDVLLEEGQILHVIGRSDESKVFLNRLLELYPAYQPAQQELDQVNAESGAQKDQNSQLQPIQKLLGSASIAVKAGNLQKARADLDKVEQLQPGLAEAATLRKRLEARKSELALSAAREQEGQRAAQKQKAAEALIGRAEELYRQGKYDETLGIVEEPQAQDPQLPQVQELRGRATEAKRSLRACETALDAGKYAEARAALEKMERINPSDPNLPALRRRAETVPIAGTVSLSLYPIGDAATLLLDGQPVGANGELVNQTIPAGRHKLQARNSSGLEVMQFHEFSSGQAVAMVYDVAGQILRPMIDADRELMHKAKAKQQIHAFAVEHNHGLLRGSCKGDLIVDYYHVVYHPAAGPHGFSIPFKDLQLRMEEKAGVLLFAADGREFFAFRFPDAQTAQALKKFWNELTSLDK